MENIEVQRFYLFFHDLSFLLQSSSLADQTIQYIVLRINLISGGNVPAVVAKTHQVNEKIYCGHSRDMSQERPRAAQPIVDLLFTDVERRRTEKMNVNRMEALRSTSTSGKC